MDEEFQVVDANENKKNHQSHLHDKYIVVPADKNPNYTAVLLLNVKFVKSRKFRFAVCTIDTILYEYYS